jgi:iron complex transport system permease protein
MSPNIDDPGHEIKETAGQEILAMDEVLTGINENYKRFTGRKTLFILSLLPILGIIAVISVSVGSAHITVWDAYSSFLHHFFPDHFTTSRVADICVWSLRLPKLLLGILAGVGLGMAGGVFQGVLRNPLASPYTLGISSGASFGASLAILSGASIVGGQYIIIGNAFVFALICSFVIIGLSSRKDSTPEVMVLAGVAMMYFFSAMTIILQFFASSDAVKSAIFWSVGDLSKATWPALITILFVGLCTVPIILYKSWDLNILSAGDEIAKGLGLDVKRVRIITITVSTLFVATIICFTGTIGFIGLVAPHICRMVIGGDNRFLIPASGLAGAVLLTAADTVARTIISPIIIPVGAVTAFMGAPVLLYILLRKKSRSYW